MVARFPTWTYVTRGKGSDVGVVDGSNITWMRGLHRDPLYSQP